MRTRIVLAVTLVLASTFLSAGPATGAVSRHTAPFASCNAGPPLNCASTDGVAVGTSTLYRSNLGVLAVNRTTGLTRRDAVTNWFVVFNRPQNCMVAGACTDQDVLAAVGGSNPAMIDILWAAGHVVGGSRATFAGTLGVGDTSGSIMPLFGQPAVGLVDPWGSEVHLIVRTHGPAIPGLIYEQTHTVNGGCDPVTEEPCADLQAAIHPPAT